MSDPLERLLTLFPQCTVSKDEINWHGRGQRRTYGRGQYIEGYPDELTLDGDFNLEELEALVAWMKNR